MNQFLKQLNSHKKRHEYIRIKMYSLGVFVLIMMMLGIYNYDFFLASKYMFVILALMSVIYLPFKANIVLLGLSFVVYSTMASLFHLGILDLNHNVNSINENGILWRYESIVLLLLAIITTLIVVLIIQTFRKEVNTLKKSKEILNSTIKNLPIPTVIIDKDLRVLFVNNAFSLQYGYQLNDIPNVRDYFNKMYSDQAEREALWESWSKVMRDAFISQQLPPTVEYPYYDKDGNKRWVEVHYSMSGEKAVIMHVDVSGKKERQQEVIKAIVHAEEEERSRMAKELHDGLGPLVTTAKIYAHTLYRDRKGEQESAHGERLVEILDETLVEIRTLSNNISPHILRNYGLRDGITSFVDKIRPISNINFNLSFEHTKKISHTQQFTIYRAIVEMINNTIKYAEATSITIAFMDIKEGVKIVYADDGKGFVWEDKKDKGLGLANIQSRIENLGGYFQYKTMPGKGVNVAIKIKCR